MKSESTDPSSRPWNRSRREPSRRRGSLYITVLGVATIVATLALSATHVARLHLKTTRSGSDRHQARLLAISAVEHAVAEFNTNSNWQTDYALGTEYPSTPVTAGAGSFTWQLTNTGGAQLRLDGIGRVGDAECTMSVDLELPVDLDCALSCDGDFTIGNNESLLVNGAPVATNGTFDIQGDLTGDVEAQSQTGGGAINGTQTVPGKVRSLPSTKTVMDYYLARGTVITPPPYYSSKIIAGEVLSPTSNPFGAPNPDGIYIVDTAGAGLIIQDCRIVGTLIVNSLSSGNSVEINDAVNWEPAYPNFPALLVDGDIDIATKDDPVDESSLVVPNLNPTGSPYQGATDSDQDDTYPSSIAGLFYCSGDLTFKAWWSETSSVHGILLAGGDCTIKDYMNTVIKYDPDLAALPPPGFGNAQLNGPVQLKALSSFSLPTTDSVAFDKFWGQFLKPTLPSSALMWRITKLEVWVEQDPAGTGQLHILTHTAKTDKNPDQVMEGVAVAYSALPTSFSWLEVPLSLPSRWLPADQGICVTLEARGGDNPANVEYESGGLSDPNAALLSGDGMAWYAPQTNKAIGFKLEGEYTTRTGAAVKIIVGSWRQTPRP